MTKFTIAFGEIGIYKEVFRSQINFSAELVAVEALLDEILAVLFANVEGNILIERFNGVPAEERLHWRSFLVKLGADNLKGARNEELLVACHNFAKQSKINGLKMNVIDRCWRPNPEWRRQRPQLATCSVGCAGKMTNNIGKDLIHYQVTDPNDDPVNPRHGTLRYGASVIQGKVWITFQRNMHIKLERPLLISSFTTIDGRGVKVDIADNACLMIFKATNVIIHNIRVHHCKPQAPGNVMGPNGRVIPLGHVDGDAIRLVTASKIWIDHNTLYDCQDGLLDVTRGSTNVTISNNWFKDQDKVMLLGHDDGYMRDQNMKVTVVYNHFGPNCNQRMPRIRYGYAHVANNLYLGWLQYAIGGSMEPSLKSEANLFIAPTIGSKEVTWRKSNNKSGDRWEFHSVGDAFENGASFVVTKGGRVPKPNYNKEQYFKVVDVKCVRSLTRSSGVLRCNKNTVC